METVLLRNGAVEASPLVTTVAQSVKSLHKTHFLAAYELLMKARDGDHACIGTTGDRLVSLGLLQANGSMHASVRNVVLSMGEGEGIHVRFVSPQKPLAPNDSTGTQRAQTPDPKHERSIP